MSFTINKGVWKIWFTNGALKLWCLANKKLISDHELCRLAKNNHQLESLKHFIG